MSDMTINLLERKRQTNKQTNSRTFHHGATEGRDGIVNGSEGKGGGGEQPCPQGFWREVEGVINRPLIFNPS